MTSWTASIAVTQKFGPFNEPWALTLGDMVYKVLN